MNRPRLHGIVVALALSGCVNDATQPAQSFKAARRVAAPAIDERTGLRIALRDVRSRILPTLSDSAAAELDAALTALEPQIATPDRTLAGTLERARGAATQIALHRAPDMDVVKLLLSRIEALQSH